MSPGRIVALVIGSIVAMIAVALVAGGAAIVWLDTTQRDADGFFTSPTYTLATESHALTSESVDLDAGPGDWWPDDLAEVRVSGAAIDGGDLFVAIGDSGAVDAYLAGVAHEEVVHLDERSDRVEYRRIDGGAPATPPTDVDIWEVQSAGPGEQTITWSLAPGEWTIVVMRPDGSAGIPVRAEAGAKTDLLPLAAGALFAFGAIAMIVAGVLIVLAVVGAKPAEPGEAGPEAVGAYPVALTGTLDPGLSRWMWLVKWFLAIPHFIVLMFLWAAFAILTIIAFFAILFTTRYPKSIFDFNVGVLRWSWRVSYYAFTVLGTDAYPPFTLSRTDYPADFDVAYPEHLSRGLVLVKWWLLAIPHYLIVGLFTTGLVWWVAEASDDVWLLQVGTGLIGLLVFFAIVALLFTGRYPQGIFDLVMGLNRWVYRVSAYASLMRDEYPPFRLDLGGDDPAMPAPPSDAAPVGIVS